MEVERKKHLPTRNHHHCRCHLGPQCCRVVMVTYPLQGHINPMLEIGSILHSKGLSITIAYPLEVLFNPPHPSTHPEFTFFPLKADGRLPPMGPTGVDGLMGLTVGLNKAYKDPFEKWVKQYLMEEGEIKLGCIIYDVFMYFAQSVADYWKIPGVGLSTFSAASLLAFVANSSSHEQPKSSIQVSMESLLGDEELQDLELDAITNQLKETKVMYDVKAILTTALSKSTATIINSMGLMERATIKKAHEYFLAPIYPLGPFHKVAQNSSRPTSLLKEDPACLAWLDQHPPGSVIYVSFGTLATITRAELVEIAMGLVQSNQPFLWVVWRGLSDSGPDWEKILHPRLNERIKEKGCIVGWAPQRRVLAHISVGGFWTNCGWNSTMESTCEGMPMICRPFFGDQFLNAKYVTKVWKIGLELEDNKLERGNIEATVRRLMVGDEGLKMRNRALDFKKKINLRIESSHEYVDQFIKSIIS